MSKRLYKAFTRSIVSQVGRDTGRLISNSLYGDKHAIPIRRVGASGKEETFYLVGESENQIEISADEYRKMREEDGWKVQYLSLGDSIGAQIWGWFLKSILFTICLFLSVFFIGIIPPLWMAIAKFRRRNVTMFKYELVPHYVQDRRYKAGVRYAGQVEQKNEIKVPANKRDKHILNVYGAIYLAVAVVCIAVFAFLLYFGFTEGFTFE